MIESNLAKKKEGKTALRRASLRALLKNKPIGIHRKLVPWFYESYRVILLPKFETTQMVNKLRSQIKCKTARMMCPWGHFSFSQAPIVNFLFTEWISLQKHAMNMVPYTTSSEHLCFPIPQNALQSWSWYPFCITYPRTWFKNWLDLRVCFLTSRWSLSPTCHRRKCKFCKFYRWSSRWANCVETSRQRRGRTQTYIYR